MPERWTHVTAKMLYGGSFEDRKTSIRALIFGEMFRLAEGHIEAYRGDLYHDAIWLTENVNGPTSFEWVVRESGTHCEHSDYIQKVIKMFGDEASLLHFRFDVIEDGSEHWKVVISQAAPSSVDLSVPDTGIEDDGEEASKILNTLDSDGPVPAWVKDSDNYVPDDDDSNGTLTEDDQGTLESVPAFPTPVNVKKTTKENGSMESILSELRSKVENAESEKNDIDEHLSEIESAKETLEGAAEELDQFISDMNDLINSLESLPEISIYVDSIEISSISFDSND